MIAKFVVGSNNKVSLEVDKMTTKGHLGQIRK